MQFAVESVYNKAIELGIGKKIKAQDVWTKVIESQIETGVPYLCSKDNANKKTNHQNIGVIKQSNLCNEIYQYTDEETTAICTLSSMVLKNFVKDGEFDHKLLYEETRKVVRALNKVIDINNYSTEKGFKGGMAQRAIAIGTQGLADVFSNMDEVLNEDYRHPIPMGIPGIDRLLKGGLAKGEIGVILAPTGVGKSTLLTKIANHAYNLGFNVLQIFFEDNPKIIQRKHYVLWTGIHPDELSNKKDDVLKKVGDIQENMPNRLLLKKLPSDTMTMLQIKNQIRKMIGDGIKIDMIMIDYIDCIVPDKNLGDEWKSEGSVMRAFEAMCHEMNVVGWTATQGNRSSISSEVVTTDQMGGSIKKAQVGHVIISVAKTLQQKEMKLATIAITKSRIGDDGVIFENCKFDNAMLEIDTESSVTFLGFEDKKEETNRNRIKELAERRQQKERQNGGV